MATPLGGPPPPMSLTEFNILLARSSLGEFREYHRWLDADVWLDGMDAEQADWEQFEEEPL